MTNDRLNNFARLLLITLANSFKTPALIYCSGQLLYWLFELTACELFGNWLKTNFGKSVELGGGNDGQIMKDFSFIASFVPIVEEWMFRMLQSSSSFATDPQSTSFT